MVNPGAMFHEKRFGFLDGGTFSEANVMRMTIFATKTPFIGRRRPRWTAGFQRASHVCGYAEAVGGEDADDRGPKVAGAIELKPSV